MGFRFDMFSLVSIFIPLMFVTMFIHKVQVKRRRRKLGNEVGERFIGSWF